MLLILAFIIIASSNPPQPFYTHYRFLVLHTHQLYTKSATIYLYDQTPRPLNILKLPPFLNLPIQSNTLSCNRSVYFVQHYPLYYSLQSLHKINTQLQPKLIKISLTRIQSFRQRFKQMDFQFTTNLQFINTQQLYSPKRSDNYSISSHQIMTRNNQQLSQSGRFHKRKQCNVPFTLIRKSDSSVQIIDSSMKNIIMLQEEILWAYSVQEMCRIQINQESESLYKKNVSLDKFLEINNHPGLLDIINLKKCIAQNIPLSLPTPAKKYTPTLIFIILSITLPLIIIISFIMWSKYSRPQRKYRFERREGIIMGMISNRKFQVKIMQSKEDANSLEKMFLLNGNNLYKPIFMQEYCKKWYFFYPLSQEKLPPFKINKLFHIIEACSYLQQNKIEKWEIRWIQQEVTVGYNHNGIGIYGLGQYIKQWFQQDLKTNMLLYDFVKRCTQTMPWSLSRLLKHILFYKSQQLLNFFQEFSNLFETLIPTQPQLGEKFQRLVSKYNVINDGWNKKLSRRVIEDICSYRKYNFSSGRDLIRVVRNKINHFYQFSESVMKEVGYSPGQVLWYFMQRFPGLMYIIYRFCVENKLRISSL